MVSQNRPGNRTRILAFRLKRLPQIRRRDDAPEATDGIPSATPCGRMGLRLVISPMASRTSEGVDQEVSGYVYPFLSWTASF